MLEEKMTIYDLVCKIIGPINPVADAAIDSKRRENLKKFDRLIQHLINDIRDIAVLSDSEYASMKSAGKYAKSILKEISSDIEQLFMPQEVDQVPQPEIIDENIRLKGVN